MRADQHPLDVVLASNVISVGLDVDRLGRTVVTCLNVSRPRERSHYERFAGCHEGFHREVEATSVTPFSGQALDRGLVGSLLSMVRHGVRAPRAEGGRPLRSSRAPSRGDGARRHRGHRGRVRELRLERAHVRRRGVPFIRFDSVTANLQGEYDFAARGVRPAVLTDPTGVERWLPAIEIRGEGIFLELDEEALSERERRGAVRRRAHRLAEALQAEPLAEVPSVRFFLLHSLSHLLLTAISLECGYAASSIRARIYCGRSEESGPDMAAILLTTGTTGGEGTLGGLVEEGGASGISCAWPGTSAGRARTIRSARRAIRRRSRASGGRSARLATASSTWRRSPASGSSVAWIGRSSSLRSATIRRSRSFEIARERGRGGAARGEHRRIAGAPRGDRGRAGARPIDRAALVGAGLGRRADVLERALDGLGSAQCPRVLEAVLAERAAGLPPPELVWTGPEASPSRARETAVVVIALAEPATHVAVHLGAVLERSWPFGAPSRGSTTTGGRSRPGRPSAACTRGAPSSTARGRSSPARTSPSGATSGTSR